MTLQIFNCEQGSPEWFAARLGVPTASEFATILAKGKKGEDSKTRRTYMLKLAGEILTGQPREEYSNPYMERGKQMEDEARKLYAFTRDLECERVGFIKCQERNTGVSPDSLITCPVHGDGGIEIKTKSPHLHLECFLKGEFPPEHKAQVQGFLWITGRMWCDLVIYWPGLPLIVKRAHPDPAFIEPLGIAVREFNAELAEIVDRVRGSGIKEDLKHSLEIEHGISQ